MSKGSEPAFPQPMIPLCDGGFTSVEIPGMSLRDYFAGQALMAAMANNNLDWKNTVRHAYQAADYMLSGREAKDICEWANSRDTK